MGKLELESKLFRELEEWELDLVSGAGNDPIVTVEVKYYSYTDGNIKTNSEVTITTTRYPDGRETVEVVTRSWTEIMETVDPY